MSLFQLMRNNFGAKTQRRLMRIRNEEKLFTSETIKVKEDYSHSY